MLPASRPRSENEISEPSFARSVLIQGRGVDRNLRPVAYLDPRTGAGAPDDRRLTCFRGLFLTDEVAADVGGQLPYVLGQRGLGIDREVQYELGAKGLAEYDLAL